MSENYSELQKFKEVKKKIQEGAKLGLIGAENLMERSDELVELWKSSQKECSHFYRCLRRRNNPLPGSSAHLYCRALVRSSDHCEGESSPGNEFSE